MRITPLLPYVAIALALLASCTETVKDPPPPPDLSEDGDPPEVEDQVDLQDLQDISPDSPSTDVDAPEADAPDGEVAPDLDTSDTEELPPLEPGVVRYPLSDQIYTTLQRTWRPLTPPPSTQSAIGSGQLLLIHFDRFAEMGLGVEPAPGEPWQARHELAPGYEEGDGEGDTTHHRSLLYFWHLADPQLIDEESPSRLEGFYLLPVASTYRPHSHLTTQVFEAHVRTIRRLSDLSGRPLDLALTSGDYADGGQLNELTWFAHIMRGGTIHPDTGERDDPIPGPGNDFTDPFFSDGIGVPWHAILGNHDILYLGFAIANERIQAITTGDEVVNFVGDLLFGMGGPGLRNGYRASWSPLAPVIDEGTLPPDPMRCIATKSEALQIFSDAGGSPHLSQAEIDAGTGYYAFHPLPGKPIRVIALDTTATDPAFSEGALDTDQFAWLQSQLLEAEHAHELVIVNSHHRSAVIRTSSGTISSEQFTNLLRRHDGVILHLAGHGHGSRAEAFTPVAPATMGYWELQGPATVDFPSQTRIMEIVYEGDQTLAVYVTNVDHNAPLQSMAHEAQALAAGRRTYFSFSFPESWEAEREHRNLILRYRLPPAFAAEIEKHTWPTQIESIATLAALPQGE